MWATIDRIAVSILASILVFSLCARWDSAASPFVEISGQIEIKSYRPTNSVGEVEQKARTYPFRCVVGSNIWTIETGFLTSVRECFSYDGTNVYRTLKPTGETDNRAQSFSNRIGAADANRRMPLMLPLTSEGLTTRPPVTITPGELPLGDLGVNIPWLAFCSGRYLRTKERIIPAPAGEIRAHFDSFGYRDKTEVFDDALGLPKAIALLVSKTRLRLGVWDPRIPRSQKSAQGRMNPPTTVPDRTLKCRYRVTSTTNCFGWRIPTGFDLMQYDIDSAGAWKPHYAASASRLNVRELAMGAIAQAEGGFLPGRRHQVTDYRFRHEEKLVDAIIYEWTNSTVPAVSDTYLQGIFREEVEKAPWDSAWPHGLGR